MAKRMRALVESISSVDVVVAGRLRVPMSAFQRKRGFSGRGDPQSGQAWRAGRVAGLMLECGKEGHMPEELKRVPKQ